jgi:hypothetical protein
MAPDAINNACYVRNQPQFKDEIQALHAAGILVEVSAGGEGPGCMTMRSPADYWEVLTTGMTTQTEPFPGVLAGFSARGPSELDGNYFPDILAPGDNIYSSLPGNDYERWSGTSLAGSHATGLVGLMWNACPALAGRVYDTIDLIHETAGPLTGQGGNCGGDYVTGPNNDWGYGTIDALAAVEAAIAQCTALGYLDGTVRDGGTLLPIDGAQITADWEGGSSWLDMTDASGYYTLSIPNGSYTVTAASFGYYPESITNVVVETDTVTTQDFDMDLLPEYIVSGSVIEAGSGDPLQAQVTVVGTPLDPVWSDPGTGIYSISVPEGASPSGQRKPAPG